jgi:hypothetical protein
MRYRVADEQPEPTHDEGRDVGKAAHVRVHYDLTPGERLAPQIESSMSLRNTSYGGAEEEENDIIETGSTQVTARSGNSHWDGDDYEIAGELRPEDRGADPGAPYAAVIAVASVIGLIYLLTRKQS